MRAAVMPFTRRRGVQLAFVLTCLGVLTAFLLSTIRTADAFQEGNDAAVYNAKGLELYRSGKFEEAVASFKQAIKLKQDYPEAYYNLGSAYSKLGEHKKAIEAYKKAIRLNPKEATAYYELGAAYVERDDKKAALEQYKILKAIDTPLADKLLILIYKPMVMVFDSVGTRLSVIATDSQGVPVPDLSQEDFQVFEDGVPQTISFFSKEQVPLVYGLTVDTSGSVRPAFDLVIGACKSIVENNLPGDETLLIRFVSSDKIETVQEFTSAKEKLNDGLDILFIEGGQSAILDAVYLSAERVAQYKFANRPLRRAILLVTDGDERTSYYSLEELLKLLRKIDVQLWAISLGKDDKKGSKLNQNQPQRSVDLLTKLASETGGQAFFPKSVPELQAMIKQMTDLIRTEYVIGYKPANSVGAGIYRRVSVSIVAKPGRENWRALTRAGYVVSEK